MVPLAAVWRVSMLHSAIMTSSLPRTLSATDVHPSARTREASGSGDYDTPRARVGCCAAPTLPAHAKWRRARAPRAHTGRNTHALASRKPSVHAGAGGEMYRSDAARARRYGARRRRLHSSPAQRAWRAPSRRLRPGLRRRRPHRAPAERRVAAQPRRALWRVDAARHTRRRRITAAAVVWDWRLRHSRHDRGR